MVGLLVTKLKKGLLLTVSEIFFLIGEYLENVQARISLFHVSVMI